MLVAKSTAVRHFALDMMMAKFDTSCEVFVQPTREVFAEDFLYRSLSSREAIDIGRQKYPEQ